MKLGSRTAADDWDGLVGQRVVRDGKVVEGRDGFLFLANDVNHVLAQHSGELRLDPEQLEHWRLALENRTQMAARKGCAHLAMIIPNSHSVYPEMLPAGIATAPERPVHQLIAHLEQAGSAMRILYPLEEMVAGKGHDARAPTVTGRTTAPFLHTNGSRQKRERSCRHAYSLLTMWCSKTSCSREAWVTSSIR